MTDQRSFNFSNQESLFDQQGQDELADLAAQATPEDHVALSLMVARSFLPTPTKGKNK